MPRGFPYPIARAVTNILMRGLQTSLIIEEMYRGTPANYAENTDYDEIAHHSGPERAAAFGPRSNLPPGASRRGARSTRSSPSSRAASVSGPPSRGAP